MGNRSYDQTLYANGVNLGSYDSNKVLYGLALDTELGTNLTGYTALLKTSDETEWRLGATYQFNNQTSFDVNYKNKDFDDVELNGIGIGLNYKF